MPNTPKNLVCAWCVEEYAHNPKQTPATQFVKAGNGQTYPACDRHATDA